MVDIIDLAEIAKHNTAESCWVILYGKVYDVTDLLSSHPGGPQAILKLAGQDATEEFDPIHPPDTLKSLKPESHVGTVSSDSLAKMMATKTSPTKEANGQREERPLNTLLNLDEIEEVATKKLSRKGWAYYFSAADDKFSKQFNTQAYRSILLRPRMFIDIRKCDLETKLLGHRVGTPIYVSPAAMARLAHPAGEAGIAEACSQFGAMQLISNNSSMSPEQIVANAAPEQIFGWQLYIQVNRKTSADLLARINRLPAIKCVVLTLDAPIAGKREDDERTSNLTAPPPATVKLLKRAEDGTPDLSNAAGGIGQNLFAGTDTSLTWTDTLQWLSTQTKLPIVLKGLQTHEDAYLASLHTPQVKAIILSNHGGRSLDYSPPAVHTLLEIRKYCPEVFDRLEVWVDGGIRRGTDVVKALCLGAKAVGIGRPPLWGLAAGGPEGVHRTLQILTDETERCMRLLGVQKVEQLGLRHINTRMAEQQIYDGPADLHTASRVLRSKL